MTACSVAEKAETAVEDANIHGTWTGTWTGEGTKSGPAPLTREQIVAATGTGEGTNTGPAKLTLEQKGRSVRGTLELQNNQCVSIAEVVGRVDDDGFSGEVTLGAMSVHFSGSVDLEEILGVYEALSTGPCPGERGNVRLFK